MKICQAFIFSNLFFLPLPNINNPLSSSNEFDDFVGSRHSGARPLHPP